MQFGTRRMKRRVFLELVTPPGSVNDPDQLAETLAPLFGHDLADQPPVVKDQMKAMRAFDLPERDTLRNFLCMTPLKGQAPIPILCLNFVALPDEHPAAKSRESVECKGR